MASDLTAFLKDLIQLPGLSAYEAPVRDRIRVEWEGLVDELTVTPIGSLHGRKHGSGPSPRPTLMLAAHMDAIGLIVSQLEGEFLRVDEIGGLDPRVLPGQQVIVHGRRELPGIIAQPPIHTLPEQDRSGPPALKYLLVDTGLTEAQLQRAARPGDLISFAQPPIELGDGVLSGHSLDNRASVAAVTECLRELGRRDHQWDVVAVASTQEEATYAGAYTSAFQLDPAAAVAVDVTWARGPGLAEHQTFPIGDGPTNGWGPNHHPGIYKELERAAGRIEVPLTREVLPRPGGTDAYAIQVARQGIPTGFLGIPLKHMHTPVEVVAIKDIERVSRILADFAAGLHSDFAEELTWD